MEQRETVIKKVLFNYCLSVCCYWNFYICTHLPFIRYSIHSILSLNISVSCGHIWILWDKHMINHQLILFICSFEYISYQLSVNVKISSSVVSLCCISKEWWYALDLVYIIILLSPHVSIHGMRLSYATINVPGHNILVYEANAVSVFDLTWFLNKYKSPHQLQIWSRFL